LTDEPAIPGSLLLMSMALRAMQTHKHDPEDTLTLAITQRELAIITFGIWLTARLFPEVSPSILQPLLHRVGELAEAQEFTLDA
jgi:hypothetical protein